MIATTNLKTAQAAPDFSDVEATSLLTLYGRAIESQSQEPILVDESAEKITHQIDGLIAGSSEPLMRMLYERRVDPRLVVHVALRAQKYDEYARDFITRFPDGAVVNLGCGMDTRFQRIDDGQLIFFDLDLPEVIRLKQSFLQETDRYQMIAGSMFEEGWMDQVAAAGRAPLIFLVEGVFMYLDEEDVKRLVLTLQSRFPGSELVCEVVNERWTHGMWKSLAAVKMQRQLKLGNGTEYNFGIGSPNEMESWSTGIQFIERWSYFETRHPKLGWMRAFSGLSMMNDVQYTVYYRLN
jgi:methyltransferase (TIGR00027 family)